MTKTIFIFLAILSITKNYSQHPELLGTSWYLSEVVIDNEVYFPPTNEEVSFVDILFNNNEYETRVCNIFFGVLIYDGNESFIIQESAITLIHCELQENAIFEGIYFSFFLDENHNHIEDDFFYEIITNGDEKTLTITNVRGDKAYYGNTHLSVVDFQPMPIVLYPNPVTDKLVIKSQQNITEITIYDIHGKPLIISIVNTEENHTTLDVNILHNGVYFIKIKTSNGNSFVRKIIKS